MIYIRKQTEPNWLSELKRKHEKMTYDSKLFQPYISRLNKELVSEQKGLCAYCCCQIDEGKSHNEHIEPRHPGTYVSKKSLDYTNVVASCYGFSGEKTCGPKKENDYDESRFVSPLNPKCEEIFTYLPDGTIEGDDYTINLLNLNSYRLKEARKAVFCILESCDIDTIKLIYPENDMKLEQFINVVRWYLKQNSDD